MIPTLSITKFRYLWRMIFRDDERCLIFFSFWDHDLGLKFASLPSFCNNDDLIVESNARS